MHNDLALPNSVVEMFKGALGVPPGGWPKKLQRSFCAAKSRIAGVPERMLEPGDFKAAKQALEKKLGTRRRRRRSC